MNSALWGLILCLCTCVYRVVAQTDVDPIESAKACQQNPFPVSGIFIDIKQLKRGDTADEYIASFLAYNFFGHQVYRLEAYTPFETVVVCDYGDDCSLVFNSGNPFNAVIGATATINGDEVDYETDSGYFVIEYLSRIPNRALPEPTTVIQKRANGVGPKRLCLS